MGISMALGSMAQMLAGSPKVYGTDTPDARNGSFLFSGPENTATQGAYIPIGYGELLIGSVVVSAETYPCGAGGRPFWREWR